MTIDQLKAMRTKFWNTIKPDTPKDEREHIIKCVDSIWELIGYLEKQNEV